MAQRNRQAGARRRARRREMARSAGAGARRVPRRHHLELPHYETVALMLQGGGALGAYQAGVYQGLDEAGIRAELDCRHLDRCVEHGDHCRQSRRKSACERLLRILGDDLPAGVRAAAAAVHRTRALQFQRRRAQGFHGNAGDGRARRRAEGLLRAALSAAVAHGVAGRRRRPATTTRRR